SICLGDKHGATPPPADLTLTKTENLPSSSQACHQRAMPGDTDGSGVGVRPVCWLCGGFFPICGISHRPILGPLQFCDPLTSSPTHYGCLSLPFFRHPKFCPNLLCKSHFKLWGAISGQFYSCFLSYTA